MIFICSGPWWYLGFFNLCIFADPSSIHGPSVPLNLFHCFYPAFQDQWKPQHCNAQAYTNPDLMSFLWGLSILGSLLIWIVYAHLISVGSASQLTVDRRIWKMLRKMVTHCRFLNVKLLESSALLPVILSWLTWPFPLPSGASLVARW